ncbi:hypothetical protein CBR_g40916 [Chara braunii]|uniref:Poly A polymerase head domain-containing protein n=1 Tax=Chara braunii TaxID=69332 RepID=A0A388K2E7_CHABU|nr:hypothetical protein CBR_g40916 [Chara braunii]|eukprot:GBG64216.1 hypothetical protein CBR_g40916 [Chara braunii]
MSGWNRGRDETRVQVKRLFPRCYIVGKRFPIVHVHIMGEIIEVSSFAETAAAHKRDLGESFDERVNMALSERHGGLAECMAQVGSLSDKMDRARRLNVLKRDFTINGLMYDPFQHIIYDYVGGVRDLQRPTVMWQP